MGACAPTIKHSSATPRNCGASNVSLTGLFTVSKKVDPKFPPHDVAGCDSASVAAAMVDVYQTSVLLQVCGSFGSQGLGHHDDCDARTCSCFLPEPLRPTSMIATSNGITLRLLGPLLMLGQLDTMKAPVGDTFQSTTPSVLRHVSIAPRLPPATTGSRHRYVADCSLEPSTVGVKVSKPMPRRSVDNPFGPGTAD